MKRLCIAILFLLFLGGTALAQFTDSSTGLLQAPTADMQKSGTFMITNNYLNKNSLPASGWGYDTFAYGFSITFWDRLEVGYVCTIFDGIRKPNATYRDSLMFNQDRHFTARVQLAREGDFGVSWLPAVVVGVSDPTTGSSANGYIDANVEGAGNGYFNRMYVAATRHFDTPYGIVGASLSYQYNQRSDYRINGPAAGISWEPVWVQNAWILDKLNVIAEYDSRTFNIGVIA